MHTIPLVGLSIEMMIFFPEIQPVVPVVVYWVHNNELLAEKIKNNDKINNCIKLVVKNLLSYLRLVYMEIVGY